MADPNHPELNMDESEPSQSYNPSSVLNLALFGLEHDEEEDEESGSAEGSDAESDLSHDASWGDAHKGVDYYELHLEQLGDFKKCMVKQDGLHPVEAAKLIDSLEMSYDEEQLYGAVWVPVLEEESDSAILRKLCDKWCDSDIPVKPEIQCDDIRCISKEYAEETFLKLFLVDPDWYIHNSDPSVEIGDDSIYKLDMKSCQVLFCSLGFHHPDRLSLKHQSMAVVRKSANIAAYADKCRRHFMQGIFDESEHSGSPICCELSDVKDIMSKLSVPQDIARELKGITYLYGFDIQNGNLSPYEHDDVLVAINRPCGIAVGVYGFYCYID